MSPLNDDERTTLLRLARTAIVDRLNPDGSLDRLEAETSLTPALVEKRGAFVTLRTSPRAGRPARLRGCIGTVLGRESLFRDVIRSATASAFEDPRFSPVTADELKELRLEVSVLTSPAAIGDPSAIVPGRDGVLLERGPSSAVFLPQVAVEQNWGREQLLEHLALKAGLDRNGWKDAKLSIFQAEVFGEPG